MKQNATNIQLKKIAILTGCLLLFVLFVRSIYLNRSGKQEETGISSETARILVEALPGEYQLRVEDRGTFLSYGQILSFLKDNGISEEEMGMKQYRYQKSDAVAAGDWFNIYDRLLERLDPQKTIVREKLTLFGNGSSVSGPGGKVLAESEILTDKGVRTAGTADLLNYLLQTVSVYCKEGTILAYRESLGGEFLLANVWMTDSTPEEVGIFSKGYRIRMKASGGEKEQIADILLADGKVKKLITKKEKINGKLLSVQSEVIEIDGQKYPLDPGATVYRLYGTLQEAGVKELPIGYSFTDFVIENGKIVACLISRDEAMENIRVLLRTSDYAETFHEKALLTCDSNVTVISGSKTTAFRAGENVEIDKNSSLFETERILIRPDALTARITLSSVNRSLGAPSYRGTIEIVKTEEGLVLINELLLEEYLYAVVPSEMPASYPIEALKSQAVCARTYAYGNLKAPGLPEYGAHVDDSTAFQVYQNIQENSQTTTAVQETKGELIYYGEGLAGTYYYSTSCGFSSDVEVWNGSQKESFPYLKAKNLGTAGDTSLASQMQDEEKFEHFLEEVGENDYEKEEAWYRWDYEAENLDPEEICARLQERFRTVPDLILTRQKDGSFAAQDIKAIGKISNISVSARKEGGIADTLLIEGSKATVAVHKEYNIRYVLSDRKSEIRKQNGETLTAGTLLPSAFFTLKLKIDKNEVVGYSIRGGGYGHGVGMSQNGAKAMAKQGAVSDKIIRFFYEGAEIRKAY